MGHPRSFANKDDAGVIFLQGAWRHTVTGLKKRSVSLAGHATSLALEPEFWAVLDAAAGADSVSLAVLIGRIDAQRGERALASACRVFALLRGNG